MAAISDIKLINISKLKKGDYFRKSNSIFAKTFIYDGKLMKNWFYYTNADDINDTFRVKKDIKVFIGFIH